MHARTDVHVRSVWSRLVKPSWLLLGMCQPRIPGTIGAEPFSAKIHYTGPDDEEFSNLVQLTVTMPHMDGERSTTPCYPSHKRTQSQSICLLRHVAGDLYETSVEL